LQAIYDHGKGKIAVRDSTFLSTSNIILTAMLTAEKSKVSAF